MASPSPPCPCPCNCRSHVTNTPTPSQYPSSSVPKIPSNRKSIEQVWKDINLGSLCNCSTDTEAPPSTFLNVLNNDSSAIFSAADSSLFQKQAPSTNSLSFQKQGLQEDYSLLLSLDTSKSSSTNLCSSSDQRFKRLMKNRESAARSRARKQETLFLHFLHLLINVEENSRLTRQVEQLQLQLCLQKSSAKPPKMRTLYRTSTCPF
ncbi:Basic-leucine zipper domain [Sesbania bispinosa]|nr:Basic-leucine zipper domain [Sesbania bispinosa]